MSKAKRSAKAKRRTRRKYRVGILGCGSTSRLFLGGWRSFANRTEVVALCDVAPQQMTDKQKLFPDVCADARTYTDYREMLSAADLDIVCVCSYSDKHLEHTEAALDAGTHVFMEKPVGYDLEEARRFKYLAYKYPHQKVAIAYSLRYMTAWMNMKGLLESGRLGQITIGKIAYCHAHHLHRRRSRRAAPGGARIPRGLVDAGGNYIASSQLTRATHPWDMARYLFGEVKEVFAARGDRGGAMGILWMRSGAMVHVLAGTIAASRRGSNQHEMVVAHGTKGSAWVNREVNSPDEIADTCTYRTSGPIRKAPSVSRLPDATHGAIIRTKNLLDAIEGKAPLICSMEDGAKTTELLHAIWLSETRGIKVPVVSANKTG